MITGHGGNIKAVAKTLACSTDKIVDMSSNLNPLGAPGNIKNIICANIDKIESLPEPDAADMKEGFARFHGIDQKCVVAGSGTTWFIYTIPRAVQSKKVLIAAPTYSDYKDAAHIHGAVYEHCFAQESDLFEFDIDRISQMAEAADTVFICNPNNPTGALVSRDKLEYLIQKHENTLFIVDESYLLFVDHAENISMVTKTGYKNLTVLSSMSKIFRIPGLRIGFLSAPEKIVDKVMFYYQPWSVNSIAQAVIKDIFDHPEKIAPFYQKTRGFIKKERQVFIELLNGIHGLQIFDSSTYFVLARLTGKMKSDELCYQIGRHKMLIRDCANFEGLSDKYVRFSLKTREDNLKLARLIKRVLQDV